MEERIGFLIDVKVKLSRDIEKFRKAGKNLWLERVKREELEAASLWLMKENEELKMAFSKRQQEEEK